MPMLVTMQMVTCFRFLWAAGRSTRCVADELFDASAEAGEWFGGLLGFDMDRLLGPDS